MAEKEAGTSGATPAAPSSGDLKSLIKQSIQELIEEDPALLGSGGRRRVATEEGKLLSGRT